MRAVAVFALLVVACGPGAEVKSGRELYLAYGCAACHGANADGLGPGAGLSHVRPRDLTKLERYRGPSSVEGISSTIAFGVAEGRTGMPAYPDIPKRERIAMAEYIHALAAEPPPARLRVQGAWVRRPSPAVDVAAAFVTLENNTGAPVALAAVSSRAAKIVEMHETKTAGGMMRFGYTHCPDACPTMMAKVARAYREAGPGARRIPTLFVSVDPRDTPAALEQYLGYFGAVPAKGLTGSKAQIDAVVKQFGAHYEIRDSGSAAGALVDHTIRLYLLDRDGDVVQLFDPAADPGEIAKAMRPGLKSRARARNIGPSP